MTMEIVPKTARLRSFDQDMFSLLRLTTYSADFYLIQLNRCRANGI
jgi:hypothetical protein